MVTRSHAATKPEPSEAAHGESSPENAQAPESPDWQIGAHAYLTLHYRIALVHNDGAETVLVDTFNDRPATLQLGSGQWAPEMEACVRSVRRPGSHRFVLPPQQAYGDRHPELVRPLALAALQAAGHDDATPLTPGAVLQLRTDDGEPFGATVIGIDDDRVTVDLNHPLAGRTLALTLQVIGVL